MEVNKEKYAADLSIQEARARSVLSYTKLHLLPQSLCMLFLEGRLFFKYECFQKGEVSIFRGARNAIFSLDDQQAAEGVVTHSRIGIGCKVRIVAYVVNTEDCSTVQSSECALIHAHADGRIISGQGTISLELLEQARHIDTIRVPISGGGLKSGVALAAKSINPAI
ncbi:putative serine racemase [Gossypium arboreum]|uniref:Putative serine racemase n=1 Tax=Gossypium arboreum TaxID=29729 RepID=A0A0B0NXF2_GOSAR|nr:putative serine racemase [Gossypium arboreum]